MLRIVLFNKSTWVLGFDIFLRWKTHGKLVIARLMRSRLVVRPDFPFIRWNLGTFNADVAVYFLMFASRVDGTPRSLAKLGPSQYSVKVDNGHENV